MRNKKFTDLLCDHGGFWIAAAKLLQYGECASYSDFHVDSQKSHRASFGEKTLGDLTKMHDCEIP